jgi:hypothetical protein
MSSRMHGSKSKTLYIVKQIIDTIVFRLMIWLLKDIDK